MKTASKTDSGHSRYSVAFAVALGLLGGAGSLAAHSANLTLSGTTVATCTYSDARLDGAGNMTITTTSECLKTPDSLAFSSTPTSVVKSGTVNVAVTRSNPGAAGVNGTVSASGGCTVDNGGAFAFAGSSTTPSPTTFTITAPGATPATCTISLITTAPGNLGTPSSFSLAVTDAPVLPNDVLAFSAPPTSVAVSGTTTVNVTRAGTNWGAVSAAVSSDGGCLVSPATANFSAGITTAVPVTITAPSATATCNVSLSAPSANVTLGAPNAFALSVTAAPPPPPPPPTEPGCSTTASVVQDMRISRKETVALSGGQTAAVKFYAPGDAKTSGAVNTVMSSEYAVPTSVQVQISACPGDFTPTTTGCGGTFASEGSAKEFAPTQLYRWTCKIDTTKTYYYNIRFPTCAGTCGVRAGMN